MANMTSGIANYSETKRFDGDPGADPYKVGTRRAGADRYRGFPLFDPGTEFNYSNTNTVLLGLVLERVTGKAIGELYRQRIIEPLDLKDTSFPDLADTSLPEPHAQGYTLQGQSSGEEPRDATDWNVSWTWTPAG